MQYMCSKCGENFKITFLQYILGLHIIGGSKLLRCSHCGKWSFCPKTETENYTRIEE